MEQSNNFFLNIILSSILDINKIINVIKSNKKLMIYLTGKKYPIIIKSNKKEEIDKTYNQLLTKINI